MKPSDLCACGRVPSSDPNPDCERCCLVWFAHKVGKMRESQKEFSKTRKQDALEKSRELEDLVDRSLKRLYELKSQMELF